MVLLFLEFFVIPGFGIAGVAGLASVVTALVMMMVALPLEVSWEIGDLSDAISRVSLAFAATMGLAFVIFKFLFNKQSHSMLQYTPSGHSFWTLLPVILIIPSAQHCRSEI